MTFQSSSPLVPQHIGNHSAPGPFVASDISVVVPVKNNRAGVHRLLSGWLRSHPPERFPQEILVVDNGSCPPLEIAPHYVERDLNVTLLTCARPGPARARNVGWRAAKTDWVLFLDSDCLPTETTLTGYLQAANGAMAYAGAVSAATSDPLSLYYEQQAILRSPTMVLAGVTRPTSLITANALVWRPALEQIGGFDERFPQAAGEDIDLGLRLWQIGPLSYAPEARVLHAFEPSLACFVRRFLRYGRGNRLLSQRYQMDLTPHPFPAACSLWSHRLLAFLQYLSLWWGYQTGRRWLASQVPPRTCFSCEQPLLLENTSSHLAIALFIDGDTISARCLRTILAYEKRLGGHLVIRRVYRRMLPSRKRDQWDKLKSSYQLEIMTVEQTQRNATDLALMQGIKTELQNSTIRQIWLASGDGGYAPLVRTLMQQGYEVLIFGPYATAKTLRKTGAQFLLV